MTSAWTKDERDYFFTQSVLLRRWFEDQNIRSGDAIVMMIMATGALIALSSKDWDDAEDGLAYAEQQTRRAAVKTYELRKTN